MTRTFAALFLLALTAPGLATAQVTADVPAVRPDAIVNLAAGDGAALVRAQWRYSDARIVEVEHRAPGPDLRASGAPNRTYDVAPHAGAADFDDSSWRAIRPEELEARRTNGRLSFGWYRVNVTIPEKVGGFSTAGSTVVFEVVVDDYAEVWVDGRQPVALGQTGAQFIKGFNAPNRVVITHAAVPGQKIQLAVFGANGPLSNPPGNFVWIRSATLDFYAKGRVGRTGESKAQVTRLDPALDAIVPVDLAVEKLADGFIFTEGPVWVPDGYLLFSDPNANTIYRWTPDGQVSVFRTKSGYAGADVAEYGQPGSNGITLDAEGRVTIDQHGNRRVIRIEKTGAVTVLADRYEGKRLNSPNDLVYRSDGALFFTDPPFGLPKAYDDRRKELPFSGVFSLKDGQLRLVAKDLEGPNGIAFSPDERYLYVANWDPKKKVVMRYPVNADATLGTGELFFDMTSAPGEDALDGVKVDVRGNLYVSGPGGLWILSPEGRHLGTIVGPEHPHNLAWGDDDGRTLYLTAQTGLYRIRLNIPGVRPGAPASARTN
ncbi:MAG TPA: SMP-30/gluconolactonase/LRE family protein [Vicinamibacterales bacterium]|nr:SMP-30/gluconolactonase/LRE family protein [Vicinamibacterales bacterium]